MSVVRSNLKLLTGSIFLFTIFMGTASAESLILWGPTSNSFYLLPVGESIVVTANVTESLSPQLKGYKTDQLSCRSVPASYQGSDNNNAKWECTGLKGGNNSNSELFITVGSDTNRSDTIVIQVEEAKRVICGFTPRGAGKQCEENMTAADCSARGGSVYTSITACWGGGSTANQEDLQLWGPSSETFYRLQVGKSIVLTGGRSELNPKLQNFKTDQLNCRSVSTSYQGSDNNNAKWECTAIKGGNNTNSEVFFTIGDQRSNTIVIQVDAASSTSGSVYCGFSPRGGGWQCEQYTPENCRAMGGNAYQSNTQCWEGSSGSGNTENGTIPPAGYEDEVLTNFSAYVNPFPDTDTDEMEGKAAAELYRRSVIGGFPDGQFKGDRPVNRAEAAKFLLLARFAEIADVSNSGRFRDVLDGQWYTKFVITAANKSIISGYPDGLFRPGNQVNTAEFLKMLALTFDLQLNMSYRYADVPSDSWFAQYAGIAQKYNLFPNRSTFLMPNAPLTRADVAIAIYQYLSQR